METRNVTYRSQPHFGCIVLSQTGDEFVTATSSVHVPCGCWPIELETDYR
jgi:hypothetical protein